MIDDTLPIDRLPLDNLGKRCQEETRHYQRGTPSDTRFCLEIFRRALLLMPTEASAPVYHDEAARTLLVQMYTEFIKANINRAAMPNTSLDDLVQDVWFRFWRAANQKLFFSSLEAALSYLKITTVSALIEARQQQRKQQRNESLERIITEAGIDRFTDTAADVFPIHVRRRFLVRCNESITDPLERRVFWLRYGMCLPPRDIVRVLKNEGVLIKNKEPTSRAVSDLLDRICKRLIHDTEIRDLLQHD